MRQRYAKLTLQNKLLVTVGMMLFVGALITTWTLIVINGVDRTITRVRIVVIEARDVLETGNTTTRLVLADLSYVLTEDETFAIEREFEKERLDAYVIEMEALLDYGELLPSDVQRFETDLRAFESDLEAYESLWIEAQQAILAQEAETARTIGVELDERAVILFEYTADIYDIFMTYTNQEIAKAEHQVIVILSVGVLAVVAFLGLSYLTANIAHNQVDKPIQALLDMAAAIEQGDYSTESLGGLIEREDEIGFLSRAFLHMAQDVSEREHTLKATIAEHRQTLSNLKG